MLHKTRDFLIRGLPVELAKKVKIAAGLHGQSMQMYVQSLLAAHVKALEKKGVTLSLPKRNRLGRLYVIALVRKSGAEFVRKWGETWGNW